MPIFNHDIEIISAPSILGLKPGGVARLADSLLASGLYDKLQIVHPVIHVPTLNDLYNPKRDAATNCLNPYTIRNYSLQLGKTVLEVINKNHFALVLGGDCSILPGIMCGLKNKEDHGLIFLDAHADFYSPEKSITGEVAGMDLAIVTGRGPDLLTKMGGQKPYAKDENVIHLGQRDQEETEKHGSPDIRETAVRCISLSEIQAKGITVITAETLRHINRLTVDRFWIHFDTDVLSDEINPAVDYRLPGGLDFGQAEYLMKYFIRTGKMAGMSVTIYNADLDANGSIAENITDCLARALEI